MKKTHPHPDHPYSTIRLTAEEYRSIKRRRRLHGAYAKDERRESEKEPVQKEYRDLL